MKSVGVDQVCSQNARAQIMKRTSLQTFCYVQQEKIGRPDPTAPGYVGTYTPPKTYKVREREKGGVLGKPDNGNNSLLSGHFKKHWENHGRNIQTDS